MHASPQTGEQQVAAHIDTWSSCRPSAASSNFCIRTLVAKRRTNKHLHRQEHHHCTMHPQQHQPQFPNGRGIRSGLLGHVRRPLCDWTEAVKPQPRHRLLKYSEKRQMAELRQPASTQRNRRPPRIDTQHKTTPQCVEGACAKWYPHLPTPEDQTDNKHAQ